jgi:hypothetical protein
MFDLNTDRYVGNGTLGGTKLSAKKQHPVQIPVIFSYASVNDSDLTCKLPILAATTTPNTFTGLNFYNACRNRQQYPDGIRPGTLSFIFSSMEVLIMTKGFNIQLILRTKIAGMIKTVTSSTQINSVNCPIELPTNSV